jgi:hypothetical protein
MSTQEFNPMDTKFSATQLHIDELDREIEGIRTERLLHSAAGDRPSLGRRARAGVGRGLISLGVALVGEGRGQSARTASVDGSF